MLPSQSKIDQLLPIDEVCLWIDPMDCTNGFLNGNYEDITVLVGLSHKNKPVAGVIGTPYQQVNEQKVYNPVVSIGSVK